MNNSKLYKYLNNKLDELMAKHNCTVDYTNNNQQCKVNPTINDLKKYIEKLEEKYEDNFR